MSNLAGSWSTLEVRPREPPRAETSQSLSFARPYVAAPAVVVGFNSLDIDKPIDIRAKVFATDVTGAGFTIHGDSWGGNQLYSTGAGWLSVAPARLDFQTGQVSVTASGQRHRVSFKYPFVTPPKVVSVLNEVDSMPKGAGDWRIQSFVVNIDTTGFTIGIETLDSSVINSATASWVAYPEDALNVTSGIFAAANAPPGQNQGRINFGGVFDRIPSVFVAFHYLQFDPNFSLRFRVYVDNISPAGMTWHIDTLGDTRLGFAGATYICFA